MNDIGDMLADNEAYKKGGLTMTNKEAIEYASKNSFLALYEKGGIDKLKELKKELVESDAVTFNQAVDFISEKIAEMEDSKC